MTGFSAGSRVLTLAISLGLSACSKVEKTQTQLNSQSDSQALNLHVASPEWQDQIIYFLMIDRFEDGNPGNNDQGAGVYGKGQRSLYNGGDLQGVIKRLDYIQQLGATTVWTTPHVANQWWDPIAQYWGYHGYWARDFKAVDEHYGTLKDYKALSHHLHNRGMYLIQDVVVNHTGNFHSYDGEFDINAPGKNFVTNPKSVPTSTPTQAPFDKTDYRNPEHKSAAIYNWRPNIIDISDYEQETTYELANLDDLNTKNPVVRNALKDSFNYWIKEAGVGGVRIDTAKYVESAFYDDFLHAEDGLLATAKAMGKEQFHSFAEILETSSPYSDRAEKKMLPYLDSAERKRIAAPIGFPLYKDIQQVFAAGKPTKQLSHRLQAAMKYYPNPHLAVNLIDNHDVERFLASGTMEGFKQAYALMMTVPGIPTIYQGDEQGFKLQRQTMFAGGYGSDRDYFDQQSDLYLFIQKLAEMRKANKVFSRGDIQILQDNSTGSGVLAYKRSYQGQSAYVIFNSAEQKSLLNHLPTGLKSEQLELLLAHNIQPDLALDQQGSLTLVMPPRSVLVFKGPDVALVKAQLKNELTIQGIQQEYINQQQVLLSGEVEQAGAQLLLVQDGRLGSAQKLTADALGKWQAEVDVSALGKHQHSLELYWPQKKQASQRYLYLTQSDITDFDVTQQDPFGDDKGLNGLYIKPESQANKCFMDIAGARVRAGGDVLELTIEMCDVSDIWGPANGFDHMALTLFMDDPSKIGNSLLPVIGGQMPQKDWDLAHASYGWGNYMFAANKQSPETEGSLLSYTPSIQVNKKNKTLNLRYSADSLGLSNWFDVGLYITVWDKEGDGLYKDITLEQEQTRWKFSGVSVNSPKILDDMYINLPEK